MTCTHCGIERECAFAGQDGPCWGEIGPAGVFGICEAPNAEDVRLDVVEPHACRGHRYYEKALSPSWYGPTGYVPRGR